MRHPKTMEWDRTFRLLFDEIDDELEDRYGSLLTLHPNRPGRGSTSSKEMDGLFTVGADFTMGYGSKLGRGYTIRIRLSTLDHVDPDLRETLVNEVEQGIRERLSRFFPDRNMEVGRDGDLLKITGDESLGSV